jgi:hypothetical protein
MAKNRSNNPDLNERERIALEAADRVARVNQEAFERGKYPGLCAGLNDGTGCPHTPQHSDDNVCH